MTAKNCNTIRRELDEVMPADNYGRSLHEHLRKCADCREFWQERVKLQQIVGSLGLVEAPPDFDFRLRARLANEKANFFHPLSGYFVRRSFATIAALLLFFVGVVVVRHFVNKSPANTVAETSKQNDAIPETRPEATARIQDSGHEPGHTIAPVEPLRSRRMAKGSRAIASASSNRRSVTTADYSSERAPLTRSERSIAGLGPLAFPIDAPIQPLRLSLDDGRGNARTISLPAVSFGSQRVLAPGNQRAPKGVW